MPLFTHGDAHCEALQLDRMNSAGRPMFGSALPPWFFDANARHHSEVGFVFWDGGQTYLRGDDGLIEIDVGDWLVREPGGSLAVYDPASFASGFREIPPFDPEEL